MALPGQAIFGTDILFNLVSVVYRQVVTAAKQRQLEIDNISEKARQLTHEYVICDQIYVEINAIYRKIYYKKQGPYRITEVFTHVKVWVQRRQVN